MIGWLLSVTVPTWVAIAWRRCHPRNRGGITRSAAPRSVIIFQLDQLGDLILTTPLFRELKRVYPGTRVAIVVPPAYMAILTTNPHIDEILPLGELKLKWLPARARRLISVLWFYWTELRGRQFDLAISPRWDADETLATLLCVLTNAGKRVGHSAQGSAAKRRLNRGFDAAFDVVVPPTTAKHEVNHNLAIVEVLGGKVENRGLEIKLTQNDRKLANELLTHHDRSRLLVAADVRPAANGRCRVMPSASRG